MSDPKRRYHGWILVEDAGPGFRDYISVEYADVKGRVVICGDTLQDQPWRGESGCARAIEWWDKKVSATVKLESTLKGCYRVYTEEAACT